jgi:hypothetical protein
MGSSTAAGGARAAHLDELRRAIASGAYSPEPATVAESVLAWLAPASVFESPVKRPERDVDVQAADH